MKRILCLFPLLVAVMFPFLSVEACGPDFFPDVFVRSLRPDNPTDYAAGKLGVLLPTYPRADLTVAYRYLNGGTLTSEEQRAYHPTIPFSEEAREFDTGDASHAEAAAGGTDYAEPSGPADLWLKARARYAPPQPDIHPVREYGTTYRAGFILAGSYENCQSDAFQTAAATLESRAKTWGAKSAELADWIRGQDAVFSNCGSAITDNYPSNRPVIHPVSPAPVPADAPALLRQDRAYQIAASQFYIAQFAPAQASFRLIAQDVDSPWHGVARYLVARSFIREAFLNSPNNADDQMADFNPALMKQAQQELESMRGEQLPGISHHSVQKLLNLVRLRTETPARLREISSALSASKPDPYYEQDLNDLSWYLNIKLDSLPVRSSADDSLFHVDRAQNDYSPLTPQQRRPGFEKTYKDLSDLRSTSPLIDWLITFQSPAASAKKHAIAEWKRAGSTPWLTIALIKADSSDADASTLIDTAARISPASPAWATISYHRLRLLIDSGRVAQARAELATAFPAIEAMRSGSTVNLFNGLRMRAAATLDDALASAPRKILEHTSEQDFSLSECLDVMKNPNRKYDCKKDTSPVEFSDDSAAIFNNQMPLSALAQAAQSSALPQPLRQSAAMTTWVRSVLLKNETVAAQMFPLLPQKLQLQAGQGIGFRPLMAILRNPGLRPYLDGGVQRSASWDFVESYDDNWWCSEWAPAFNENDAPIRPGSAAFLSPEMREAGEKETKALLALGSAEEYLGSEVVGYARAHPSDPDVPEALFLTLRTIRYGCYHGWAMQAGKNTDRVGSIAREVGAIMRRRYTANPWTKKAAPYVWPPETQGRPVS